MNTLRIALKKVSPEQLFMGSVLSMSSEERRIKIRKEIEEWHEKPNAEIWKRQREEQQKKLFWVGMI